MRWWAAAVLFLLTQAPSQQPQQPPPRFRGGTNLVRVDAYATKDGVPIQDLTAADFEILEDNAPQKIDSFEHVVIDPARAGERVDPASPSQAVQLAADPHRRLFVIFLDIEHVDVSGSGTIKEPLIDLMNRVMSADDLVGIMTPEMGPDQIAFGRKTEAIEGALRGKYWDWGRRDEQIPDEQELLYQQCFPPANRHDTLPSQLAKEMAIRRKEKIVLDSLHDLVRYMAAIREGRTAVITVSDGWVLYKADPSMTIPRKDDNGNNADPTPGTPPPIGVGSGGTLSNRPNANPNMSDYDTCNKERFALAHLDDEQRLKDLFGEANQANVSFYTIDPRGLVVFDALPGPDPLLDQAILKTRHNSLEILAVNTDGLFLLNSNDLHAQLRKIADDLTSYYLIGYYSTNTKLDGRFRKIRVRSKRPGVEIRARQGYRAATENEVTAARAATSMAIPEEKAAVTRALGTIEIDARAQGRTPPRGPGEPAVFHRGPLTGNQLQPASARIFPRSDRYIWRWKLPRARLWTGAPRSQRHEDRVPVSPGERTDARPASGG